MVTSQALLALSKPSYISSIFFSLLKVFFFLFLLVASLFFGLFINIFFSNTGF